MFITAVCVLFFMFVACIVRSYGISYRLLLDKVTLMIVLKGL